jgi:hypothetical protein
MMGILVAETCWGNKTKYFAASSWFFAFHYVYDARSHKHQICKYYIGEMHVIYSSQTLTGVIKTINVLILCNMNLDVRNEYKICVGESECKDLRRIIRQLLENNIKMDLIKVSFENVHWFHPIQNKVQCRSVCRHLLVQWKRGNFLCSVTCNCSRRPPFNGDNLALLKIIPSNTDLNEI